jgi:hypothetical protein
MIQKLNITIELEDFETPAFEHWLNDHVKVLDFIVVADTSELYKNDPLFKKMSKEVKDAKKARDRYYNEKR